MVFVRESNFNIFEISSGHSHYLLFKSRNEGVATKLKRMTLSFSAFERYVINISVKIDHSDVAVSCCFFFNYYEFSMTFLQTSKLSAQLFFSHFSFLYWNFQTFVIAELHFRFNRDLRFEDKGLTFSKLLNINFRTVYREDISLFNRFTVSFRKKNVDCILVQAFYTKTGFKDRAWHFTFTEAWYVSFLNDFVKSFIKCCCNAFCVNFYFKNSKVLLYFFPCCFHIILFPPKYRFTSLLQKMIQSTHRITIILYTTLLYLSSREVFTKPLSARYAPSN
ncbi:hypothetical protein D3C78_904370 [compost metagenome]